MPLYVHNGKIKGGICIMPGFDRDEFWKKILSMYQTARENNYLIKLSEEQTRELKALYIENYIPMEKLSHYDDEKFDSDRYELIEEMHKNGVDYIINAGADMKSSLAGIHLSEKFPFFYAAVGVHPHDAENMTEEDIQTLREYSKTNPEWVRNFIEKYKDKMNKLSIKEASKYI